MKIVCESCSAKYSIADEKVAGKVFKIRCKRCSEVIVVRGDQQQAEEDATRVYDYAVDAVWHVVVNGEQQGPFSPPQIGEMLTNAQIDWEAYVWREGFDNWLPARDVPDLVEAVTGQAAGESYDEAPAEEVYEAPAPVAAAAPARAQSQSRSMGADPFADDGGGADPGLFGGDGGRSGGDLFGGGAAAAANPFGGGHDDGVVASAPNPRVESAQSMTGARNENSVLFSLKNLQALATGGNEGGGGGSAGPAASPSPRGGFATGEGSGLIDIRALASATGLGGDGGHADKDELLSMGGGQTGAFSSLGSPMLAPPMAAEEPSNKNTLLYAGFGVMALIVLGMGGGMFYLLTREQGPVAQAPDQEQIVAAAAAIAAAAAAAPAAAPVEEPTEGEKAAANLAAEAAAKEDDSSEGSSSSRRKRSGGGSSSASGSAPAASAAAASGGGETTKAPAKRSGPASIDDLLGEAMGGGSSSAKKAAPAPAASNLPEQPSRDDVMNALRGVDDAVKACGGGQHGVAMAAITVAGNTGRVSSVNVSGQFQGTPIGSCVARAVRGARFEKFSRPDFKVNFPFRL